MIAFISDYTISWCDSDIIHSTILFVFIFEKKEITNFKRNI